MDEEKPERGFKVEDRRRFASDGETRPAEDAPEERREDPPAPEAGEERRQPEPSPVHEHALPPMSFSTFVMSLSTQALILLGEMPDPSNQEIAPDLAGAQQLIDVLAILQEKTRGNLDAGETNLLDSILYNLRMQYVERARGD